MAQLITQQVDTLSAQLNRKLDVMASQLGIDPAMAEGSATGSPRSPTDLDAELAELGMDGDSETILPGTPTTVQVTGKGNQSFRLP